MRFRKEKRAPVFELNITPLIDVVFLLLIFFMVSTTFVFNNAIDVDLPRARGDETSLERSVRVSVTADGRIIVDGQPVRYEQVPVVMERIHAENEHATVVIEADTDVRHGAVVHVMDAGRKAGYSKFAIAVEEE